jgi:hypothetical protein
MNSVGLRRGGFGSSAPPITHAPRVPARSSGLQASGRENGASHASSSSMSESGSGGPALQRVMAPRPSAASTLGRLHQGGVELQRPKTPPTDITTASPAADPNHDSAYADTVFQTSVYVSEYLKLVSLAAPSAAARQVAAAAAARGADAAGPSAGSTPTSGVDVYLIEQSRMKHQQLSWRAQVGADLSAPQQRALEELVRQLGTGVQANRLADVLEFQAQLASGAEPLLVRSLLANNLVLDAWVDYLYGAKAFPALVALVQQRLAAGVDAQRFPLSRSSMIKLLAACAVEGDASASIMVLRESSWAALAKPADHEAAAAEDALGSSLSGIPSSVGRLPSWVPAYYSSGAAAADIDALATAPSAPRALEAEDAPDQLLAASGDGFGAEAAQALTAPAAPPAVTAARPRLSINLSARALYRSPSLSGFIGSSSSLLGASSTGQASKLAGMSTRARGGREVRGSDPEPAVQPAAAATSDRDSGPALATPPPSPATPLAVIDLWTELSVDSRLMELALVAAARAQSRASELEARATAAAIAANARANPQSEHAEINQSLYEHAQAMLAQSRRNSNASANAHANAILSPSNGARSLARRGRAGSLRSAGDRDVDAFEEEVEPDSADDEFDFGDAEDGGEGSAGGSASLFQTLNGAGASGAGPLPPLSFQLWSLMLQQQVPLQHPHSFGQLMGGLRAHVEAAHDPAPATGGSGRGSGPSSASESASSVLLSTLSAEMAHSRRLGAPLQHKWLRADVAAFRSAELALHQQLAASAADSADSADHAFQCLETLREMQAEGLPLAPQSLAAVVALYRSALNDAEAGLARSKLLQDIELALDDYSAVDTAVSMDAVIDEIEKGDAHDAQIN